ncbi:MAG: AzlC family ABC transporter permease [Solobacterium sp.]|nr:AzlC family ABC transporter permease [Solobacterium sp.]
MKDRSFPAAFRATIPVMTGYVVLAIGFGLLCQRSGFPWWTGIAMSIFIYGGSMQFVTVGLLTSGASLITAALTTLMVHARHLFYGISMLDRYRHAGAGQTYMIYTLTDETYSLVCTDDLPEGCDANRYRFFVSMFNHIWWIGGTVLGVLLGEVLPFNTAGIEFSMTALFVTVFTEQWLTAKTHIPALIGLVSSVVSLLVFGPGRFLIPAMIMITVLMILCRPLIERPGEGQA